MCVCVFSSELFLTVRHSRSWSFTPSRSQVMISNKDESKARDHRHSVCVCHHVYTVMHVLQQNDVSSFSCV